MTSTTLSPVTRTAPLQFARESGSQTALSPVMNTALLQFHRESGSQTTEYALIMVVAATIASLALAWARNGAIADLLTGVLDHVRSLFGMG
jgi:Flp pilus assembly pilin Flp